MPMHRSLMLSLAVGLSAAGAAVASAQEAGQPFPGARQDADVTFTTTRPHASTGQSILIPYFNPEHPRFDSEDPRTKPPAVRRIVTRLHPGTRIDTRVPARCTASDAELSAEGAAACPARSRVGGGTVQIDLGIPAPRREPPRVAFTDVVLLNERDQLIFVARERQSGARVVVRAAVRGNTIDVPVPPAPGTPPDGGALLLVRQSIAAISSGRGRNRRAYMTTPRRCPRSGRWTNRATFTYSDGVSQTVSSPTPCVRAARRRGRVDQPRFTG